MENLQEVSIPPELLPVPEMPSRYGGVIHSFPPIFIPQSARTSDAGA